MEFEELLQGNATGSASQYKDQSELPADDQRTPRHVDRSKKFRRHQDKALYLTDKFTTVNFRLAGVTSLKRIWKRLEAVVALAVFTHCNLLLDRQKFKSCVW